MKCINSVVNEGTYTDKVFLLSEKEVTNNVSYTNRAAYPTWYALNITNAYIYEKNCSGLECGTNWYLRDNGSNGAKYVKHIKDKNVIDSIGIIVTSGRDTIRPALVLTK